MTAKESIIKAHDFTNKAEDVLTCQRDANTRAAMAVGGDNEIYRKIRAS